MITIRETNYSSDIAVSVSGLTKVYDKFTIDDISFDIPRGCITGIIGPNGAGKSTTINLLLGLIQPDYGSMSIFGKPVCDSNSAIRQYIGTVLDEGNFYDFLTLKQMTKIISSFYNNWDHSVYEQLSEKLNLDQNKKISDLSKGMRMKYSISLSLSHHAEIMIMDEPTSGLDPIVREELLDILQEYMVNESNSVIFSTHITSDLDKIADYIILINDGKILLYEEKDALLNRHCIVKGSTDLLDNETEKYFISINRSAYGFEALSSNRQEILSRFTDSVVIEKPDLEKVMLHYVRSDK
jgi:ABC-2 type transport system ATP-binding protein